MSRTSSQRSVQEWLQVLDWDLHSRKPYVVLDPFDNEGLMYLVEKDYLALHRTALSAGEPLIVIARPGTVRPGSKNNSDKQSGSTNSPFAHSTNYTYNSYDMFKGFRKVDGLVFLDQRNLISMFMNYASYMIHILNIGNPRAQKACVKPFTYRLLKIVKSNGGLYMLKYLKVAIFVVNSYIANTPLTSSESLGMRIGIRNGLPSILPKEVRSIIRTKGPSRVLKLWLTILYSYKGLTVDPGKPDLRTITDLPLFMPPEVWGVFVSDFFSYLKRLRWIKFPRLKTVPSFAAEVAVDNEFPRGGTEPPSGLSAGPNFSISKLSMLLDGLALYAHGLHSSFIEYLKETKQYHILAAFSVFESQRLCDAKDFFYRKDAIPMISEIFAFQQSAKYCDLVSRVLERAHVYKFIAHLGKLCLKYEAAGKVRVFAIVDYWTNWAFKSLHEWVFDLIKQFPTDATFDQQGTVNRFAQKYGKSSLHSFDLSAATDSISIELYRPLLVQIIGTKGAELWIKLIRERPFHFEGKSCFYSCGQPMGALSSWAMLALVHHLLVQYAAFLHFKRIRFFTCYLVLGDDIVIAHKEVASLYLDLCSQYSIPISVSKSYISEKLFNFASQTFCEGENISPLSLREVAGIRNHAQMSEFIARASARGYFRGVSASFRAYFTPHQWAKQALYSIRGQFSIHGVRVVRAMLLPTQSHRLVGNNVALRFWVSLFYTNLRGIMATLSNPSFTWVRSPDLTVLEFPWEETSRHYCQNLVSYFESVIQNKWNARLQEREELSIFVRSARGDGSKSFLKSFLAHCALFSLDREKLKVQRVFAEWLDKDIKSMQVNADGRLSLERRSYRYEDDWNQVLNLVSLQATPVLSTVEKVILEADREVRRKSLNLSSTEVRMLRFSSEVSNFVNNRTSPKLLNPWRGGMKKT